MFFSPLLVSLNPLAISLIALSETTARMGGFYHTHTRASLKSKGVYAPWEEAIEIGRKSGSPVHLTHFRQPQQGEGSHHGYLGLVEDAQYEERALQLPDSFTLALFSDGILEILPPRNLIEKEEYFLGVFEESADSPEELVTRLGLDRVETAPDDIAALFLSKRG